MRPLYPDTMTIKSTPPRRQAGKRTKLFDSNGSRVLGEESKTPLFDASTTPYDSQLFWVFHSAKRLRGIAQILRIVNHKILIYINVRSKRQLILSSQDVVIDWER